MRCRLVMSVSGPIIRVESNEGTDVRETIAASLVGAGFGLLSLKAQTPSLEDIFVELVTEEVSMDA